MTFYYLEIWLAYWFDLLTKHLLNLYFMPYAIIGSTN